MDSKAMNLLPRKKLTRLNPKAVLVASFVFLMAWTALGSVWPELPPVTPLDNPDAGFKYAAGLYHSQEALKDEAKANHDKELLARAYLSAGRSEDAQDLLDSGLLPSRDLALQFRLIDEDQWKDLEEESWKEALRDPDGESRFWLAKMASAKGQNLEARSLYEIILRENPASIFVPVSQELLASLPFEDQGPRVKAPVLPGGFRVQWGVFRDAARARKQRSVIEAYGQIVEILPFESDGIPLSRVVSEAFATRDEAQREGESLRSRYAMEFVIYAEEAAGD
jgi:hypothetical protein